MTAVQDREAPAPARAVRLRDGALSVRLRPRVVATVAGLVAGLLVVGTLLLTTGDYPISPPDVLRALLGGGDDGAAYVVTELRLPRLLTAVLVGAALALSGAIFQSLVRNPLASPEIIGMDAGASTGAVLVIVAFRDAPLSVSAGAVAGGLMAALAVYLLAWRNGVLGYRLVLVGVGVTAVLDAVTAYLLRRGDLLAAQEALTWLFGSLAGKTWDTVRLIALALVVLLPVALALGRRLTILELGDDSARALGVPIDRSRLLLVVTATCLSAVAVTAVGPVAFIALTAPQISRRLCGLSGPQLIPAALTGGLLLAGSDLAAQRLFSPTQVPVGVATATLGGLYLTWLLYREWQGDRT